VVGVIGLGISLGAASCFLSNLSVPRTVTQHPEIRTQIAKKTLKLMSGKVERPESTALLSNGDPVDRRPRASTDLTADLVFGSVARCRVEHPE
jgi:hypothetical protein